MTNPSRITLKFAELRRTGNMGLVAYLTAGDPSLAATEQFVLALAKAGASPCIAVANVRTGRARESTPPESNRSPDILLPMEQAQCRGNKAAHVAASRHVAKVGALPP